MNKIIFLFSTFLATIFIANHSFSQVVGAELVKLEELYDAEKYEKCLTKAEGYCANDKYRKEPEPYLWATMCWFELYRSEDEKIQKAYPDALKQALKWAAKFVKKDKEDLFFSSNSYFFYELKMAAIENAEQYMDAKNYRKASYAYKAIAKYDLKDYNVLFMKGVCDALNNNAGEAERNMGIAITNLNLNYADKRYKPDKASEPLLIDAFVLFSDFLMEKSEADSARRTMVWAKKFLPENEDIEAQYSKIVQ